MRVKRRGYYGRRVKSRSYGRRRSRRTSTRRARVPGSAIKIGYRL